MIRDVIIIAGLVLSAVFSLSVNIVMHEAGHYAVASYYGAEPKITFNITESGFGFALNGKPMAETSYLPKTTAKQDFWIALAGPAVNLAAFVVLFIFLACVKIKNSFVRLFLQSFAVVALLAFLANIIPTSGTDGFVILSLMK